LPIGEGSFFCLKAFVIQANLTERIALQCTVKNIKMSKTGPHSIYTSEQNASIGPYPLTNRTRKVYCQKVFVIEANVKEGIWFKQCPLTKAAGLLCSKFASTENPQFTQKGLESVCTFLCICTSPIGDNEEL